MESDSAKIRISRETLGKVVINQLCSNEELLARARRAIIEFASYYADTDDYEESVFKMVVSPLCDLVCILEANETFKRELCHE